MGHKQGTKIKGLVLKRVCILGISCPKQGQGFKPSTAQTAQTAQRASWGVTKSMDSLQISLDQPGLAFSACNNPVSSLFCTQVILKLFAEFY